MIAELGHFSLILALGISCCLMLLPAWGVHSRNLTLMHTGGSMAAGLFVFLLTSFVCLGYAFITDDFSVSYVARNSNTALPIAWRISAPAPVANTNGTTPAVKAIEVINMGRKRIRHAANMASKCDKPVSC